MGSLGQTPGVGGRPSGGGGGKDFPGSCGEPTSGIRGDPAATSPAGEASWVDGGDEEMGNQGGKRGKQWV